MALVGSQSPSRWRPPKSPPLSQPPPSTLGTVRPRCESIRSGRFPPPPASSCLGTRSAQTGRSPSTAGDPCLGLHSSFAPALLLNSSRTEGTLRFVPTAHLPSAPHSPVKLSHRRRFHCSAEGYAFPSGSARFAARRRQCSPGPCLVTYPMAASSHASTMTLADLAQGRGYPPCRICFGYA